MEAGTIVIDMHKVTALLAAMLLRHGTALPTLYGPYKRFRVLARRSIVRALMRQSPECIVSAAAAVNAMMTAPPLDDAVHTEAFAFPAYNVNRYDPTRVPLGIICAPPCVKVVDLDGTVGRGVVATTDIEVGTVLGKYEGTLVRGDALMSLHPYAWSRTVSSDVNDTIIGSPYAWSSYVNDPHGMRTDDGRAATANVESVILHVPSPSGRGRNLTWVGLRASRAIAAGEQLLVQYNKDDSGCSKYWEFQDTRRRVFEAMVDTIQRHAGEPLVFMMSQVYATLRKLGINGPVSLTPWTPLFDALGCMSMAPVLSGVKRKHKHTTAAAGAAAAVAGAAVDADADTDTDTDAAPSALVRSAPAPAVDADADTDTDTDAAPSALVRSAPAPAVSTVAITP